MDVELRVTFGSSFVLARPKKNEAAVPKLGSRGLEEPGC
jgi:hypothetical protein